MSSLQSTLYLHSYISHIISYCILQAHYSLKKGAALLGLGVNAVHMVATDNKGRMDVNALERAIQASRERVRIRYYGFELQKLF